MGLQREKDKHEHRCEHRHHKEAGHTEGISKIKKQWGRK